MDNNHINENMKQLFIHFLKQNNAYEKFMNNFNNRNKISTYYPKISFILYFEITNETIIISHAFRWATSFENLLFWINLNQKWVTFLLAQQKNNFK